MTEHDLKVWPEFFAPLYEGRKTCELRLNDRLFKEGDKLRLREWNQTDGTHTGRVVFAEVTHIVDCGPWLTSGYVALSIRRLLP